MKKKTKQPVESLADELRPEYTADDLKGGIRGKYFERYRANAPLIMLEPDVASAFPDAEAVNEALRLLIKLAQSQLAQTR